MNSISISDGTDTVTLLSEIEFSLQPSWIGSTSVTAGGKTVMDIIGIKHVLTIPVGWLSKSDLSKLVSMIEASPVLSVSYPSLSEDVTEDFVFELPQLTAFKYGDSGVEQWYGVTLKAVQQGVD